MDSDGQLVRQLLTQLESPIENVHLLLALLAAPLQAIGLLPPKYRKYNVNPLPTGAFSIKRHIPAVQHALLKYIIPTWKHVLLENDATLLLEQFFCPDAFSFASPAAGDVILLAYSTILALPLNDDSIHLLARMTREYPLDRLHSAIFLSHREKGRGIVSWEDYVRNLCAVPAKVANALGDRKKPSPPLLEQGPYFNNVSLRCEILIYSLSKSPYQESLPAVAYLIEKLVHLGVFPRAIPTSRSQPSFFQVTLPKIRTRLNAPNCALIWPDTILAIQSALTLQSVLSSLFASLSLPNEPTDDAPSERTLVKHEARLLRQIIGTLKPDRSEIWECVSGLILGREWSEGYARIFSCWAAEDRHSLNEQGLELLLHRTLETWSSPEHIKHSLLAQHRYMTALLLLTVSYFPPSSPQVERLGTSSSFISAVGLYVGHLDNAVRRCGMLAAEVVAHRAGKKLDFKDWDGDQPGKVWCRQMRTLLLGRDIDAADDVVTASVQDEPVEEISTAGAQAATHRAMPVFTNPDGYDSDDSLTGYASEPSSSRAASPTPSELEELEKDPSLGIDRKKITRPVYLAQLGQMIRNTSGAKQTDANEEADSIEMALACAEELIRRKADYGTELEENAVNLVHGFVGLQDSYELDDFETKRQLAVNALVACCPRKAAPSLIEEFYKNQYSINQRYVILNALAIGARELATLPIPAHMASQVTVGRTSFPSKLLPGAEHHKYSGQGGTVLHILDDISREAIDRDKEANADKVPEIVRERKLRITKPTKITELRNATTSRDTSLSLLNAKTKKKTTFTDVATEFFIAPLINRFWLFLRDEQTREERTAHRQGRNRYKGAGTGLLLNPLVLVQFLGTLTVLVHAATNAPEWLAVVAPDALELAITLGTRPISQNDDDDDDDDDEKVEGGLNSSEESKGKEAWVLTTALELALVVLDGCLQLDGGRSLGLDHTSKLLGAEEWAGLVFSQLDKGVRVEGGGGAQEVRLKRAAAGVLLKVDELTSRWRRSMVDVR